MKTPSGKKNFLLAKKPFSLNPTLPAIFKQAVRFHDRPRLFRVLDAHDVVQPRLLAHCIDIYIFAFELIDDGSGLLEIRARETARFVHAALDPLRQQWTIEPTEWCSVAFHTKERGINIADLVVQMFVELGFDIARIGR